jgi:plasmid stabilization system protein ParE
VKLEVTQYAIDHLVVSIEVTMKDIDHGKKAAIVDEVIDGAHFLLAHPKAGQVEVRLANGREYRRWVIGHFKIIYRIDGDRIIVTDIFDSRQDPRNIRL